MQYNSIRKKHPALYRMLEKEIRRQTETINVIASENYASAAVLEALATPFVNKYAEGYSGKRYYPGNEICDLIERRAISAAKKLFKLGKDWHVNVQPYSGSSANAAIYIALMNFACPEHGRGRDTLMGMELASGGHLTHGHPVTFSGKAYATVQYGVRAETGRIDYDEVSRLAKKHMPRVIVSGFSAYPRAVDFKKFYEIAKKVGAYHVADISHIAGMVAAGFHPSPFPYADVVMTTTHKTLRGPRGAIIFCKKELAEKIDTAVFPGFQGGPHINVIFAKAVAFEEARTPSFNAYQKQIIKNAKALADELQKHGAKLVAGGTDTHLVLIDLRGYGMDGREAERRLEKIGITANRNSIPGDAKPLRPSGIRLGVPAVTTRGMKEREMRIIARSIVGAIRGDDAARIQKDVSDLCRYFPLE